MRDCALGDDEIGLAVSAYVEADRAFLDAVSSGLAPQPSFDDAVVAHRLVDAAYRRRCRGTPVILARPTLGRGPSPQGGEHLRRGAGWPDDTAPSM